MSEREKILACIREALRAPARSPAHHGNGAPHPRAPGEIRKILPAVGGSLQERLALFQKHSVDLKTDFHLVDSENALKNRLLKLRDAEAWTKIAAHAGPLADVACRALGLPVCRTDQPYEVRALESCSAGITECDALIAQTGSVLVTSRSAGGRAISALPPHHVVLARRDQLLSGLPEAFALLQKKYSGDYPSFISLITGPSRTGDIERILVLGAHGPKKLTIFCL